MVARVVTMTAVPAVAAGVRPGAKVVMVAVPVVAAAVAVRRVKGAVAASAATDTVTAAMARPALRVG
jgi:hypothetical protein